MDDVEVQVHLLRLVGDLEGRAVHDAAARKRRQRRWQVRRVFCDLVEQHTCIESLALRPGDEAGMRRP